MKFKKLFLLLPMIAITSCGYSLSYLVKGNKYNSPVFSENYYQHWDNELKNAKQVSSKDLNNDEFITSFNDIDKIDQGCSVSDIYEYGNQYRMNKANDMFNYGYQSKLFDGVIECDGVGFQLLRVQTDKDGFSVAFSKESSELRYLALQFKSTTDNKCPCLAVGEEGEPYIHQNDYDLFHSSTITLHTSIYCRNNENKIEKHVYTSEIVNEHTNQGNCYIFFGFDLREEHLSRVVGYSINYEYNDELINWNIEKGVTSLPQYALFLYELFMPYTTWH